MSAAQIVEQAEVAYDWQFSEKDVTFGKWNFKGGREVFVGSQYLGYILKGQFVADSRNW